MDYQRIYNRLIEKARNRTLEGYKETHHIIPRCIGGLDEKENLTDLTPEEHYLAHQLLVKIYPNNHAIIRAAVMMMPRRPSNKLYGWLRRKFSEAQSISQSGKGNSQYNTMWIHSRGLKMNKKIQTKEKIPEGWEKGRIINFDKPPIFCKVNICKSCMNKEKAEYWYKEFKESKSNSLREFVRNSDYDKSHVSFIKMLKTYIPEFKPEQGKNFR